MNPRLGRWVLFLTLMASACGPGAPSPGQEEALRAVPAAAGLARTEVLSHVAHRGLRRLEFHPATGAGAAFRERITTDGRGRFAIEPVEALGSSIPDWGSFELLQRSSQGFIFRYRDFAIRDEGLFERNYTWTRLPRASFVAGRPCERFRVVRDVGVRVEYELSLDSATGLILGCDEFDDAGRLVASMVYEEFELDPALEGVLWHQPGNQEQALDRRQDLAAQVGVATLEARLLPTGYALREAATVVDGFGRRWLKLTYLDGVEPLFFFQALEAPTEDMQEAALSWGESLSSATEPRASRVVVFQIGSATVLQGTVAGFDLMAIGKVPQAELLDLLESSLP